MIEVRKPHILDDNDPKNPIVPGAFKSQGFKRNVPFVLNKISFQIPSDWDAASSHLLYVLNLLAENVVGSHTENLSRILKDDVLIIHRPDGRKNAYRFTDDGANRLAEYVLTRYVGVLRPTNPEVLQAERHNPPIHQEARVISPPPAENPETGKSVITKEEQERQLTVLGKAAVIFQRLGLPLPLFDYRLDIGLAFDTLVEHLYEELNK